MQETTSTRRIHPLLATAAVAVIVFSGVGIAAITGVLPHSLGSSKDSTAPAQAAASQAPSPVAVEPAAVEPAAEPAEPSAMPPAAPKSTPRAVHKKVARARAPVQVAEVAPVPAAPAAAVPPPPPAPIAMAPQPIPGALGVIEAVREVKETPKTNGAGPILGGLAGAVAGHQVGQGKGNILATLAGAAGGALGGLAVEGKVRETKHWDVVVRLDNGTAQTLRSDTQPFWHGGERVRLLDGKLTPAS
jgi:outer membrane lipoprotein SlyB